MLAQITAPSTNSDAYLPVHPGAAAFYNGTQESFLDQWGNAIFLAPMIFGVLISVAAAAWKFLREGANLERVNERLDRCSALGRRVRFGQRGRASLKSSVRSTRSFRCSA